MSRKSNNPFIHNAWFTNPDLGNIHVWERVRRHLSNKIHPCPVYFMKNHKPKEDIWDRFAFGNDFV